MKLHKKAYPSEKEYKYFNPIGFMRFWYMRKGSISHPIKLKALMYKKFIRLKK